jgi:tetratricopeptide (TPR) repeat protein
METARRAPNADTRLHKPAGPPKPGLPGVQPSRLHVSFWPLLIFGVALAARLAYLGQSAANPTFATPVMDSYDYDDLARALLDGHTPHTPLLWQPVLYPLFLAGVYKVTGGSILAARLVQAAIGAFTCLLTYVLGVKILGRRAGIIAGAIVALYGPLIFFDADLTATGWAAFFAVVLVLLFMHVAESGNWLAGAALGACTALNILTRPTFVPVVAAGAIWLVFTARAKPHLKGGTQRVPRPPRALFLKTVLIPLAGFVAVTGLLAAWSYPRSGHTGLLPASGGINFYIGNNRNADETIAARPGRDWRALEDLPAQHGVQGDMWQQQRFYYTEALRDIGRAPADFVRGLVDKGVEFFTSRELPRSEDIYVFRRWSRLLSMLLWKLGGFGFPFGVLLPLGVIGLIHCRRLIPAPLWFMLVLYPLAIVLVFNAARYRVPIIPVLAVPAAGGVLAVIEEVRKRKWGALAGYGVLSGLTLAVATIPGPFRTEQINYNAELHLLLGNRYAYEQKQAPAIEQFEAGLRFDPDNSDLHANLATALLTTGQVDGAIAHYAAAVRLRPGSALNHARFGLALFQGDDLERAMEEYRRALELEPGYWSQLGVALEKSGRLDEAIDAYRRAAQLSPNEVIIRYNLGAALAKRGELEGAASELRATVQLDPNYSDARYELARTLRQLGRTDEALAELRELLSRKADHQAARRLLTQIVAEKQSGS